MVQILPIYEIKQALADMSEKLKREE